MKPLPRIVLLVTAVSAAVLGFLWMRSAPPREQGAAGPQGLPSRADAATAAVGTEGEDSTLGESGERPAE